MKQFLFILACAGFFLATSLNNNSHAQASPVGAAGKGGWNVSPTPTPIPDTGDAKRPGGGFINLPPAIPARIGHELSLHTPDVTWAGIANGRVQFAFSGGQGCTMYNIWWHRPGKAEVKESRLPQPKGSTYFTILETPLPDTVYTFSVQAQRTSKSQVFEGQTAVGWKDYVEKTAVRVIRFRTPAAPPGPSMADKIRATATTSPFDLKLIETSVRLKPAPIVGR